MTRPGTINSHLTSELTLRRILETSCRQGYSEIGNTARQIILTGIWDDTPNPIRELETLNFAERIGDKELIGPACYRVMCSKYSVKDDYRDFVWELNVGQKARLEHGRKQLTLKWQEIFEGWGIQTAADGSAWLQDAWIALAQGRYPLHDVVSRIKAARAAVLFTVNAVGKHSSLRIQLEEIKSSTYMYSVLRLLIVRYVPILTANHKTPLRPHATNELPKEKGNYGQLDGLNIDSAASG